MTPLPPWRGEARSIGLNGTAPAHGLRAGNHLPLILPQTPFTTETPMSIQPRFQSANSALTRRRPTGSRRPASRPCLEPLEGRRLLTTFTVLNLQDSGPGSLRGAILAANGAPGADQIRFAPAARDGAITLTGGQLSITDDLTIDGPGASRLAVSGNDAGRVFQIGVSASVSVDGLTVTRGLAIGQGGGILNAGGTLTLSHVVLSDNQVVGLPGATLGTVQDAFGGGIFNAGTLVVRHSDFVDNQSTGADGTPGTIGSSALGGAIMSGGTAAAPATATVGHSSFRGNRAVGGAAGVGASRAGIGGAIANATGAVTVGHSKFHDNRAVGGLGGSSPGGFGTGAGGAIGNVARLGDAILAVSHSTFLDNRAIGGAAGTGAPPQDGRGGAIANYIFGGLATPVTVAATASVDRSALLGNQAIGGVGPTTSGNGQGGGIANLNGGVLTVTRSSVTLNRAVGGAGDGGNGGSGQGGGIFNGGAIPIGPPSMRLDGSLIVFNRAAGGAAGAGGAVGLGLGGGLYLAPGGVASAQRTAVFANQASTSDDDVFGTLV